MDSCFRIFSDEGVSGDASSIFFLQFKYKLELRRCRSKDAAFCTISFRESSPALVSSNPANLVVTLAS